MTSFTQATTIIDEFIDRFYPSSPEVDGKTADVASTSPDPQPSAQTLRLPLISALSHTSTSTIQASYCMPPFDNSAMDGYAVHSSQTLDASAENPVRFRVLGEIAAGDEPPVVRAGDMEGERTCWAIMTGAPFPIVMDEDGQEGEDGYDACVKLELVDAEYGCDRKLESITITAPVPGRANRRLAGEDIRVGDVLLREEEIVRKEHVMVLASMGIQDIEVRTRSMPTTEYRGRPLRIGIINTGKEVVLNQPTTQNANNTPNSLDGSASHTKLGTSQIWNSNGPYIHATLLSLGLPATSITVLQIPLAPNQNGDDPLAFQSLVRSALEGVEPYDILISTGGVSMGTHDYVPSSILALGGQIGFHKLRMRPGGPMLFAHLENARGGRTAYFGLPGNPVAAAVCMRFIVGPAILRMRDGAIIPSKGKIVGIRGPEIVQRKPALSRMYVPAIIRPGSAYGVPEVEALARGSNMTLGLVRADGWVCFPEGEGKDTVVDGDLVELYEM